MSFIKDHIKNQIPLPALNVLGGVKDGLQRAWEIPSAILHPLRRKSIRALSEMRDQHKGKRCFIIGNGPSLQNTDLSKLKDEYTFGLNRIFLQFPALGFTTSYFVSINNLVIEQSANEIRALSIPKFLSWRAHHLVDPCPNTIFLHTTYTGPKFSRNSCGRLWEGATVTNIALQLAYHLGFKQVILIGVDHNFKTKGKPNTTVVSQGDDEDHFHVNYFGRGFRWQLPDLETSEIAYKMAREAFAEDHREILDATVGGKLTVFPKIDYDSLF